MLPCVHTAAPSLRTRVVTHDCGQVFKKEVEKLRNAWFKPLEQLTLEPYERDHAIVVCEYRAAASKGTSQASNSVSQHSTQCEQR